MRSTVDRPDGEMGSAAAAAAPPPASPFETPSRESHADTRGAGASAARVMPMVESADHNIFGHIFFYFFF
jgi:hypothetical protein